MAPNIGSTGVALDSVTEHTPVHSSAVPPLDVYPLAEYGGEHHKDDQRHLAGDGDEGCNKYDITLFNVVFRK